MHESQILSSEFHSVALCHAHLLARFLSIPILLLISSPFGAAYKRVLYIASDVCPDNVAVRVGA